MRRIPRFKALNKWIIVNLLGAARHLESKSQCKGLTFSPSPNVPNLARLCPRNGHLNWTAVLTPSC